METVIGFSFPCVIMMEKRNKTVVIVQVCWSVCWNNVWYFFSHHCEAKSTALDCLIVLDSATVAVKDVYSYICLGDCPLFSVNLSLWFPTPSLPQVEIVAVLSTWVTPSNHLKFVSEVEHARSLTSILCRAV